MDDAADRANITKTERAYLKDCAGCGTFAITLPHRSADGRTFCSDYCVEWAALPTGFCPKCVADTTDEGIDGLTSINGIGFAFRGRDGKCPNCRSIIRRTWFTIFFIPVIPLRRYRVIHSSPTSFFNRRLRDHL